MVKDPLEARNEVTACLQMCCVYLVHVYIVYALKSAQHFLVLIVLFQATYDCFEILVHLDQSQVWCAGIKGSLKLRRFKDEVVLAQLFYEI